MLINDKFEGFPIDFFTFNEDDFNPSEQVEKYEFTRDELELEDGYIGNSLYEKINFNNKETVL